jgi:hypothetical protein
MTFTDIQNVITDRLKIKSTDTDSITRIGRLINLAYREITAGLGMSASRRSTISASASIASNLITFSGAEKIERVFYVDDTDIILTEIAFLEMRELSLSSSDTPTRFAIKSRTDDTITVAFDVNFATTMTVYADVWATVATLSGSDEPAFPSSYHDVLVHAVLGQEYLRAEKPALADREEAKYNRRMTQLRNWNAVSATMRLRQGQAEGDTAGEGGSAGGGGSSLTVTGPAAGVSTDNAIARWDGATGRVIQNSGITIADGASGTLAGSNSGDVTLAGTPDYITISGQVITRSEIQNDDLRDSAGLSVIGRGANSSGDVADITAVTDGHVLRLSGTTLAFGTVATAGLTDEAVTYAKMQHVSAASRLLGRGSAGGAGDVEEVAPSNNIWISGTAISAVPSGGDTHVQFNDGGVFGAESGLTYDKTGDILSVVGGIKERSRSAAMGEWTSYAPTWTGGSPSIGNGTLTGRYMQIGKTVFFNIYLEAGGTTNFGGAAWEFSLPVSADETKDAFGVYMLDSGTSHYRGVGFINTTSTCTIAVDSGSLVGPTVPFTWASGDVLRLSGSYSIA